MLKKIYLKEGREKFLVRRHPWVYSGAIQQVQTQPESGETVDICDAKGVFIARAAFSPDSQIRARVWTWDQVEIDTQFFRQRLIGASQVRDAVMKFSPKSGVRLVHAESDRLPGLIVDRYGPVLSVQFLSAGVERWREEILDQLEQLFSPSSIYERSDAEVRRLEGLVERTGLVRGDPLPDKLLIEEGGLNFRVDVQAGHKTGFYLDQRDNRSVVRHLAEGKQVLDCFCYTGGFAVNALMGGAAGVTAVDSSAQALDSVREHLQINHLDLTKVELVQGDVFQILRQLRDQAKKYDLVVLDPPKFAPTAALAQKAARGYKDINMLAMKLLSPGGFLVTFSCSGGVNRELFQKILAGAALDAGVQAQILARLGQAADHPVALNFPEGEYLKGFVIRVAQI